MMILVPDDELKKLVPGFIVQCAQCAYAIDPRTDRTATCHITGKRVDLNVPRICSISEERH